MFTRKDSSKQRWSWTEIFIFTYLLHKNLKNFQNLWDQPQGAKKKYYVNWRILSLGLRPVVRWNKTSTSQSKTCHLLTRQFRAWLILRSSRWSLLVPPKRTLTYNGLDSVRPQKMELFITTSNPTLFESLIFLVERIPNLNWIRNFCLLGCDALISSSCFPTIRRKVLSPYGGKTVLRKIAEYLQGSMAFRSIRQWSLSTLLQPPDLTLNKWKASIRKERTKGTAKKKRKKMWKEEQVKKCQRIECIQCNHCPFNTQCYLNT